MAMNTELRGRRIELVHTPDPYTKLVPGDKGTIRWTRFDGISDTVAVDWDSGSTLTLVEGTDRWRVID